MIRPGTSPIAGGFTVFTERTHIQDRCSCAEAEPSPGVVPARRDGACATGEAPRPWPQRLVEQLAALQELLAAARFEGAGVQ
ncbi:hypothetical protein BH24GEM3_BH24GEM3_07700 [soil metagenome]